MKAKFDSDQLREMILDRHGDVGGIAKKLKVDSEELRTFIYMSPLLTRAMSEVIARAVDKAVVVLFDGLEDDNYGNQISAAKQVLKTRAAQRRGFHQAQDIEMRLPGKSGALTLTWLPPEPAKEPPLIEGKVNDD